MEIKHLSQHFSVCRLEEANAGQVLSLYEGNPQYFEKMHSGPSLDGVLHDMRALPPGKQREDKHFLGFFEGEALAAVMDLIEGFPNEHTAFIGLFMVSSDMQGRGVGSGIITEVIAALRTYGFKSVRLGYVEENVQSRLFWYKQGFTPTGARSEQEGYTVIIMQKLLDEA